MKSSAVRNRLGSEVVSKFKKPWAVNCTTEITEEEDGITGLAGTTVTVGGVSDGDRVVQFKR